MSIIFCALLYIFASSKYVDPIKPPIIIEPIESTTQSNGIEIVEISAKNSNSSPPRRIKRLYSEDFDRSSPDSQKLIFSPARDSKPRMLEKPSVINLNSIPANHKMTSRMSKPRPFHPLAKYQTSETTVNNINDIIQQNLNPRQLKRRPKLHKLNSAAEPSTMGPIKLSGTYRQNRKNGELTKIFQHDTRQNEFERDTQMLPDPFYNLKPNSPLEINQLAINGLKDIPTKTPQNPYFRRKFKHQVASIPHYNIKSKDVAGIYQNVLNSEKRFEVDRIESLKNKPFSLMLDVYPYNNEESESNQFSQIHQKQPRLPRIKPFKGYHQDLSYYNQFISRYPAFIRYPQTQPETSNIHSVGLNKPSQLVVHLNLYPKNKAPNKRSSTEEEPEHKKVLPDVLKIETFKNLTHDSPVSINFNLNTNSHPENLHHHINLPLDPYTRNLNQHISFPRESPIENLHQQINMPPYQNFTIITEPTFKPNYYYDENDDNQSLIAAPSMAYSKIHRDRPMQLLFKNLTTTTNPLKNVSDHKHIYKTINRPGKPSNNNNTF